MSTRRRPIARKSVAARPGADLGTAWTKLALVLGVITAALSLGNAMLNALLPPPPSPAVVVVVTHALPPPDCRPTAP